MPDLDGMGVLTRMRDLKITTPVIVQTAHGSIETVISAMRAGAHDFVVKPVGAERLQISIKNALSADALAGEIRRISRRAQGVLTFKDLVSRSDEMARVIRLGDRAAHSSIPVLIEGESASARSLWREPFRAVGPQGQAIRHRQLRRIARQSRRINSVWS